MNTIQKVLIVLVVICFYVFVHELAHASIFYVYDCKDIKFGLDINGIFTESVCDNDEAKLATAINEIVGYTVALPLFVIIIMLILKEEKC